MKIHDIILFIEINNIKYVVDYNGYLEIPNFPEKINITELGLWFTEGDTIKIHILDKKPQNIKLEIIKANIFDYHLPSNNYFINKNGLVLSIITKSHLENLKYLDLTLTSIVKILNRYQYQKDLFTVYLADLDFSYQTKFHKFPIGEVIIKINDKRFNNYNEFIELTSNDIVSITTIDNEIFYV